MSGEGKRRAEAGVEELQAALGRAERRRDDLARMLAESDRELALARSLVTWVAHLERSRSWRAMRPLRAIARAIRKALRRPGGLPDPPRVPGIAAPPGASPIQGIIEQTRRSTSPGPDFEEFDPSIAAGEARGAKAIAFHLPQFHPIPENDRWWGRGFSEWRNVARAIPRFAGHLQPRIPRDLGFYDLSDPRVLPRQAELAAAAGLHGFAFYYYSFDGKRVLERPLEIFLADRSIDIGFCLTWANENWTRSWDGRDEEVLIRQRHSRRHEARLVDDLQRHFDDPRYVRIDGRPLFCVYRLDIIPGAAEAVARWRDLWRERHGEDPLIMLVQSFEDDPRPYGADGAVEFPPARVARWDNPINDRLEIFDPEFAGHVLDYPTVAAEAMQQGAAPFPWIRGVTPSWDNEARRPGAGPVLHGANPDIYERWLRSAVDYARENPVAGESLVFVNAWNEWAEGAYLEPDVHFGAAYLNATARAITGASTPAPRIEAGSAPAATPGAGRTKVLLVGHDAHPHGAQINLRSLGDRLTNQFGCEIAYLLLGEGALTSDYQAQGRTVVARDGGEIAAEAIELRKRGYSSAIVNSVASGSAVAPLKAAGYRVVSLVHELPGIIAEKNLEAEASAIAAQSDRVVFPADAVERAFRSIADVPHERSLIKPQGLYREGRRPQPGEVQRLRTGLGIPDGAGVVLNIGFADRRKGVDRFVDAAKRVPALHFVWVGNLAPEAIELREQLPADLSTRVHFAPFTEMIDPYLELADVFFLSSREDPFPAVVLEALDAGLPVVAFRGSGGSDHLVERYGRLVPDDDPAALAAALRECAAEESRELAEQRRRVVRDEYRYDDWAFTLLQLLDERLRKVSVVVPNYNYAAHLGARLESIFAQTAPVFEVMVLDDASTDSSLRRLEEIRARTGRRFQVVANEVNSGSVFRQWERGCSLARGDYVWIAEADDLSRPEFIATLAKKLDEDVAFAFSDSAQIDEQGRRLGESYKGYYRRAVGDLMDRDFTLPGEDFVRRCLAERNLVLNVSSVIWSRSALVEVLSRSAEALSDYELSGDWHLYAAAALRGRRVAYAADPVNVHRRHSESVTATLDKRSHLAEVRRIHGQLDLWLGSNGATRRRMEEYERELEHQFELSNRP